MLKTLINFEPTNPAHLITNGLGFVSGYYLSKELLPPDGQDDLVPQLIGTTGVLLASNVVYDRFVKDTQINDTINEALSVSNAPVHAVVNYSGALCAAYLGFQAAPPLGLENKLLYSSVAAVAGLILSNVLYKKVSDATGLGIVDQLMADLGITPGEAVLGGAGAYGVYKGGKWGYGQYSQYNQSGQVAEEGAAEGAEESGTSVLESIGQTAETFVEDLPELLEIGGAVATA